MVESSMNDYEFDKYINELFESIGAGDHIILSIADTVPPLAKFDRILKIAKMAEKFGPVKA
jgi:cell division protein FtsL